MKEKVLRLIDLENISQPEVDYSKIMIEVLGYRNPLIGRKYVFEKKFKQAILLVEEAKQIVIKDIQWTEDCVIKRPNSIDNITFRAMMEIQALLSSNHGKSVTQLMIEMISIACFSENVKEDYSSNTQSFKDFTHKVSQCNLIHMLGLYNWIDKELEQSALRWEKLFLSVQLEDKDYEMAGGSRMKQFNVLLTVKSLCQEFNCTYDQAWQMSYALTQTNSYAKACQGFTQDQMRRIKEARMKQTRDANKY